MKQCNTCKKMKDITEFYVSNNRIRNECKQCQSQYKKKYRLSHLEEEKIRHHNWSNNNKDKLKIINRNKHLKIRYKLTSEEIQQMWIEQNKQCKSCHKDIMLPIPGYKIDRSKVVYVDHDHETDIVRGLLCHHCNSIIGFAKDDILILQNAIKYLELTRNS